VVDERAALIEALNNNGVPKSKAGIRLYNQKYFAVRYDGEKTPITWYLKKVEIKNIFRKKEEPVLLKLTS
jgi:ribosomal protein L25 (general stress protein Ctc)